MIFEKVKKVIRKYGLIKKEDKILVGVSGGPDSVALLYTLVTLQKEFGLSLHVAHLDHMLRKGSAKDAAFVKNLAEKLNLPSTITNVNIKALAKKGSIEEIARNARLGFFFNLAKEIKADKIALGHNLDDQAETVLMRLIRGSGLYGLAGILPKREIAGFQIIRPLIEVRRKEIEKFLKKKKIRFVIDHTNRQNLYLRNKIRNQLLPLLESKFNKNIKEILSNTAVSLGDDYDYLQKQAQRLAKDKGTKIKLSKFLNLHSAMQRLILRLNIAKLQGNTRRIEFRHINEIIDMVYNRPVGSVVDLPAGISVRKTDDKIFLDITE